MKANTKNIKNIKKWHYKSKMTDANSRLKNGKIKKSKMRKSKKKFHETKMK